MIRAFLLAVLPALTASCGETTAPPDDIGVANPSLDADDTADLTVAEVDAATVVLAPVDTLPGTDATPDIAFDSGPDAATDVLSADIPADIPADVTVCGICDVCNGRSCVSSGMAVKTSHHPPRLTPPPESSH